MSVYVIGDTHGNPAALRRLSGVLPGDTVISVGDWGYSDSVTNSLPFTVHVNKGNKEAWKSIDLSGNGAYRLPGDVISVEGIKIGFVPGAASPNGIIAGKTRRRNEMPVVADWSDKPDIVISHDAPTGSPLEDFDRWVFPYDRKRVEKSRLIVAEMIRQSGAMRVVHGHYHRAMEYEWEGRSVRSLSAFETTGEMIKLA